MFPPLLNIANAYSHHYPSGVKCIFLAELIWWQSFLKFSSVFFVMYALGKIMTFCLVLFVRPKNTVNWNGSLHSIYVMERILMLPMRITCKEAWGPYIGNIYQVNIFISPLFNACNANFSLALVSQSRSVFLYFVLLTVASYEQPTGFCVAIKYFNFQGILWLTSCLVRRLLFFTQLCINFIVRSYSLVPISLSQKSLG